MKDIFFEINHPLCYNKPRKSQKSQMPLIRQ